MTRVFALVTVLFVGTSGRAELPAAVAQALDRMPVELPAEVGYTMDVAQGTTQSTERYDPTEPAGSRWKLLARSGREPTAEELAAYRQQLASGRQPGYRASFRPDQVDRTAAEVVRESGSHLTVRVRFTESAAGADKMLGHLDLTLLVRKSPATIASYRLQLREPYTPVIGVKMDALDSGAELDETGRPLRSWSRFEGRIFLRRTDERVEIRYRDYAIVPTETPAP